MTNNRLIAADATFMVLYIGLSAGMAVLSLLLLWLVAIGVEPVLPIVVAALLNVAGWLMLPLAPRIYGRLLGQPFSWRQNVVLGGISEL